MHMKMSFQIMISLVFSIVCENCINFLLNAFIEKTLILENSVNSIES
jgi:hypothetical protein